MPVPRKVLLLNDTTNWYHFGCTATSTALKDSIVKRGFSLTAMPITETYKLKISANDYDSFTDRKHYINFALNNPWFIHQLAKHDVVIINGEGTLHDVRPGPVNLLYLAYVAKHFLQKHVEIVNHSVYPKDDLSSDEKAVRLYGLVYNAIDFAAIREPISCRVMESHGVKATESFDSMPIYIKSHYERHHTKEDKMLLVAGSAAWMHLVNVLGSDKSSVADYEPALYQFARYLKYMSDQGYNINFLFGANDSPSKDDQELIQLMNRLLEKVGCKWNVITATSTNDWLGIIERATLLVSGRFHHSIAAACLGTPFIALNTNTPKVDGMLQVLGKKPTLKYNDPEIVEKLVTETELVLKETDRSAQVLESLSEKAEANFVGLNSLSVELQNNAAKTIQKSWKQYLERKDTSSQDSMLTQYG